MQLVPLVQHSRCPAQTDGFSRRKNCGLLVTLGNAVPLKGNGQPMPPVTWPPSSSILSDPLKRCNNSRLHMFCSPTPGTFRACCAYLLLKVIESVSPNKTRPLRRELKRERRSTPWVA